MTKASTLRAIAEKAKEILMGESVVVRIDCDRVLVGGWGTMEHVSHGTKVSFTISDTDFRKFVELLPSIESLVPSSWKMKTTVGPVIVFSLAPSIIH